MSDFASALLENIVSLLLVVNKYKIVRRSSELLVILIAELDLLDVKGINIMGAIIKK